MLGACQGVAAREAPVGLRSIASSCDNYRLASERDTQQRGSTARTPGNVTHSTSREPNTAKTRFVNQSAAQYLLCLARPWARPSPELAGGHACPRVREVPRDLRGNCAVAGHR